VHTTHSSSQEMHLKAMEHHLPCKITRCYLPPDTGEHILP